MRKWMLFLILIPLFSWSQPNKNKSYYLIDSLSINEYTETDKNLIKEALDKFHASKDDTNKVKALSLICENMIHQDWEKYQYFQYELIENLLSNEPDEKTKKVLLTYKATALNNIGLIYKNLGNYDKALDYFKQALNIYELPKDKNSIGDCYNNIGLLYKHKGDVNEAIKYYQLGLKLKTEYNDPKGIALSLNNIGLAYQNIGDFQKAIDYCLKSLKIREEIGYKKGIAQSLNNIAMIYNSQGLINEALEYYDKSLKIFQELNDKEGIAFNLSNVGVINYDLGNIDKTEQLYKQSLKIREELNDKKGIAESLNNLAYVYDKKDSLDKALEYFHKSLVLNKEIGIKKSMSNNMSSIAYILHKQGKDNEALKYALNSLELSQEIGYPHNIRSSATILKNIYQKQGNYKKALEFFSLEIQMKDSLMNESTQQQATKLQAKYEYEKAQAIKNKEYENKLAIEKEAKAKQKIITYSVVAGLAMLVIFLFIVFNRLKITQKQKVIIEIKNNEILDSINYAKRIQRAILPPDKTIKKHLPNSFILYKPKDIVAGDFYWLEQKDNKILFAACDCTGHGVPGAMVSVVCNNGLNRSVREHNLTDPGKILDKTRDIVIQEFEKSEEEVKDGMDIALCSLEGNLLQYAGAHNPLWIIRKNAEEIEEIKADKQPIGKYAEPTPYTTHKIELQKGDTVYIFSDGYADQFGGEKGKKFKAANFKKFLLSIQHEPIEKHRELIDDMFEKWKGGLEQLDDVCVIGVRV